MQRKRSGYRKVQQPKFRYRINRQIRVPEVRLVGENVEQGVYDTREAQRIADDLEMDLVEISPKADPPVCRIVDYRKFLYEKKKKEKEIKAKAVKTVIKEIRFGPNTDEHDFEFKAKHAEKFLKEGAKVKAFVYFRGRTIVFKNRGEMILLRFSQRLEEFGVPEQMPHMDGRRMFLTLAPKKNLKIKKKVSDKANPKHAAKKQAEKEGKSEQEEKSDVEDKAVDDTKATTDKSSAAKESTDSGSTSAEQVASTGENPTTGEQPAPDQGDADKD